MMDQNNTPFNNQTNAHYENNNPTERPGYYTTQQNSNWQDSRSEGDPFTQDPYAQEAFRADGRKMRYPVNNGQKPPKSRLGLGIVIGILIMAVAAAAFFVAVGLISGQRGSRPSQNASSGSALEEGSYEEKLDTIKQYLDAYYMGQIDPEQMEDSLAKGMLSGIGDKYAQYYSEKEYKELLEGISGNFSGIGVTVALNDDNRIEIYKVFENSPAFEAGLKVGDLIIEAAGETDFETVDDLVVLVRGEEGTTVDLKVLRDQEELEFTVERRRIEVPTIEYKMLDNKIGYIQIAEFEVATVAQFNNALEALENEGMTSLILDLRDNPGGDYDSVVAMADRVLPEGVIISTKDKNGNVQSENSDEAHKLTVPCVVLVNKNSASAAELFTGALQDYGIATVVGTTTYGKGVVQSIFSLPDGSGMKFTTETYYTPKGRDINGVGITPDVEVELPEDIYEDGILSEEEDTQLQKALEILEAH